MNLLTAVDINKIVTLYKKGESNSCIAKKASYSQWTVWKVVKLFKETDETCNWPSHGRKRTVQAKHLVKNMREKLSRNSCCSAAKITAEAGVSQTSMHWILKEDLRTYLYKMHKRHELSTTHEHTRLDRCQHILNLMKDGTVPNLVFTAQKNFDIQQCLNHQNDRVWSRDGWVEGRRVSQCQNPLSVMVWVAITDTGRFPLVFVPPLEKLNSQHDILEAELLAWTRKHFDGAPWTLEQDSAPSHGYKMTPKLDSGPHSSVHYQRWMALKEPRFEPAWFFCVVNSGE